MENQILISVPVRIFCLDPDFVAPSEERSKALLESVLVQCKQGFLLNYNFSSYILDRWEVYLLLFIFSDSFLEVQLLEFQI